MAKAATPAWAICCTKRTKSIRPRQYSRHVHRRRRLLERSGAKPAAAAQFEITIGGGSVGALAEADTAAEERNSRGLV